jgi:prophage antirepressor-like protein
MTDPTKTIAVTPFYFEDSEVRTATDKYGNPWFVARDVLDGMGSSTPVTKAMSSVKQGLGDGFTNGIPILDSLGRVQQVTVISEPAVTFLVSRSNTERGRKLNRWIHSEVLPQIRKTGQYGKHAASLPQTYLEALKALVHSEEAREKAEAENRAMAQQIETDKPFTNLARAMTDKGTTMYRRDWIAMMKTDHGARAGERQVNRWLLDQGYVYRNERGSVRAYAKHHDLFTLEGEEYNGKYVKVLKLTGEGVRVLTPRVLAEFGQDVACVDESF